MKEKNVIFLIKFYRRLKNEQKTNFKISSNNSFGWFG